MLCVLPEDSAPPACESQHGLKVRRLASVTYFNPSGVRACARCSDPEPERDLETVIWLISNQ